MYTRALLLALGLGAQAVNAADTSPQRVVLPAGVVPTHYSLAVTPDPAHMSFTGSVQIDLDVKQATRQIELNAADLSFGKVSLSGSDEAPSVAFDAKQQTVTLGFKSPVGAGHHVLSIDYSGTINQHPSGLFALDYDTPAGKKRALFTQFENSDARRFLPSWDEPGVKSTFSLTVTLPADQMAVANTPIVKTEKLPGGLARTTFQQSPRMSSYLLFLCAGDFERIHRKVDGVDVGIVVQRGVASQAGYALDVAARLLPYYEDYFGVRFPLHKLDLIGGPGQSQFFGAMENWGAIFYFERDLLLDPKISTEEDRRNVNIVIAHEMAHQWFGDLVTMAWWDDLWLNEGFASWMEYKAADHFNPEWHLWLRSAAAKEGAMRVDARASTHPIITPIADVLQASQAFDGITYSKGQAVIRMLEDYVGADNFRDGVRAYIKAHAYGNTVTDDLWSELDKTAGLSITEVAHGFTLQPGIPLLRVTTTAKGLRIVQDRFTADGSGKPALTWQVPVIVASAAGKPLWHGLVSADHPADVSVAKGTLAVVNAGQAGYYRTLYDAASFGGIAAQFGALQPADQLGMLNDSKALGLAGYEPMGDFMQLTTQASPGMDTLVSQQLVTQLRDLDDYYEGLPGQAAFKAYGRKVLAPLFAAVGWDAKPGEDPNVGLQRTALLTALGEFDDTAVVDEARRRFTAYLKAPQGLSPDQRQVVLAIVVDHADAATWEQLHGLAKAATSNLEKRQLYRLLAVVHDRNLAQRALELSLTDELPATTRPSMLAAASNYYPELALDFFMAHQDAYDAVIEPASLSRFAPRLVLGARDTAVISKLESYAAQRIPPDARGDVAKSEAAIRERAAIRSQRLPELDAWLKAHAG